MIKKILIVLLTIISFGCMASGFVYLKYQEVLSIRADIGKISETSEYAKKLNEYTDGIISIGNINKAHKPWINEFISKESSKDKPLITLSILLKKLENKNISLEGIQKGKIEVILKDIKELRKLRELSHNEAIAKYKELSDNKILSLIEEKLVGEKLDPSKIKLY